MFLKNDQKGRTMTEMLGVLTIVIMLGASIISLVGNIWGMFKQNLVVNEVRDLQKYISEAYKADGNYEKLFKDANTAADVAQRLCNQKIAPFQVCAGDGLRHRQGGNIQISGVKNAKNVIDKFQMTLDNLPAKTCLAIAEINWFLQKRSEIYQMKINAGTDSELVVNLPQNTEGDAVNLYTFSIGDAMTHCNLGTENVIDLVFF